MTHDGLFNDQFFERGRDALGIKGFLIKVVADSLVGNFRGNPAGNFIEAGQFEQPEWRMCLIRQFFYLEVAKRLPLSQ